MECRYLAEESEMMCEKISNGPHDASMGLVYLASLLPEKINNSCFYVGEYTIHGWSGT